MAIILKKNFKDISIKQAIELKKDLSLKNAKANDVCFVKNENCYYIFNGYAWQEVDLIIE